MRFASAVVVLLVAALPLAAVAGQDNNVRSGFSTGEKYMKMTPAQKRYYVMGLVNGMLLAPLFGAPKENMAQIEKCITDMSDNQMVAILTKYLKENPAQWNETPHVPMYKALTETCSQ